MSADSLVILVGIPPHVRAAIGGEAVLGRLDAAHPALSGWNRPTTRNVTRRARPRPMASSSFPPSVTAPAVLRTGGRLRWLQSVSAGVDDLLTPALLAADHVTITSTKGPMGPFIAEHAVLLDAGAGPWPAGLLSRTRPSAAGGASRRNRPERPAIAPNSSARRSRSWGVGEVGGCLARLCRTGFGMHVLGLSRTRFDSPHVDRYIERADLHAALAEADVVALCLALTPTTARMIDAAALAAMKPSATLINVSRGALVRRASTDRGAA